MNKIYLCILLSFALMACNKYDYETTRNLQSADNAYNAKDYKTFISLIQPLANAGNPTAQSKLGLAYYKGYGVPQDHEKAFELTSSAAKQGDMIAQINLGAMYYEGKGVTQDLEKAFNSFQDAAEQGSDIAQTNIAWMLYKGDGVRQDYKKAYDLSVTLAEKNYAGAQQALGEMYETGNGVELDYIQAYMWYLLSIKDDHNDKLTRDDKNHGQEKVAALQEKLTSDQLYKATQMADEWLAKHTTPLPSQP